MSIRTRPSNDKRTTKLGSFPSPPVVVVVVAAAAAVVSLRLLEDPARPQPVDPIVGWDDPTVSNSNGKSINNRRPSRFRVLN